MTGMDDLASSSATGGASRGRWLRVALVASLALNLFLAGIMGVWAVKPLFRGHHGSGPGEGIVERLAGRLPEADQPILRQAFAKRPDIGRLLEEARKAQQDARRTLRANPFDPEAFRAATERVRAARDAAQSEIHQAVREAATQMSAEGRTKLARGRRSN